MRLGQDRERVFLVTMDWQREEPVRYSVSMSTDVRLATYGYDASEKAMISGETADTHLYDAVECSFSSPRNPTVTVVNLAPESGVEFWPSRDPICDSGSAVGLQYPLMGSRVFKGSLGGRWQRFPRTPSRRPAFPQAEPFQASTFHAVDPSSMGGE